MMMMMMMMSKIKSSAMAVRPRDAIC